MSTHRYTWSLPSRPASFYASSELEFSLELEIDDDLYRTWAERNRLDRTDFHGRWHGLVVESVMQAEPVFRPLLERLYELYSQRVADPSRVRHVDVVEYLLAFVQWFRYSLDADSVGIEEYARYPIETLHDETGDCECLAILLAALLYHAGVANVALLHLPGHIAVGVSDDLDGSLRTERRIEQGKRSYAYCEATATGWRAGQVPSEYREAGFAVYPITADREDR